MQFWTFLHIITMFAGVTFAWGGELFVVYAIKRRDLAAIRAYDRMSGTVDAVGGILAFVGIAFGLIAAAVGGLDLLQGWLVLAYVLVALAIVAGVASLPYHGRLRAAIEASEGDEPSAEVDALLRSPVPFVYAAAGITLVVLIIAVMVFKPSF